MTRFTAAAVLTVLLVAGTSSGQRTLPVTHLKKADPDRLLVSFWKEEECPGTEVDYLKAIEGELLRARLECLCNPAGLRPVEQVYLLAVMTCGGNDETTVYNIDVAFAKDQLLEDPEPNEIPRVVLKFFPGYGSYGHDPDLDRVPDTLKSHLRESVSRALTDYRKANFLNR